MSSDEHVLGLHPDSCDQCRGYNAAKTEIERLRAENAALFGQTALERRRANNEKARAEKLAAALRDLADASEALLASDPEMPSHRATEDAYEVALHAARALADGERKK